jgi:hypothetical protein
MALASWYFVCDRCNAKWFAAKKSMRCPRCGRRESSDEQFFFPWTAAAAEKPAQRVSRTTNH